MARLVAGPLERQLVLDCNYFGCTFQTSVLGMTRRQNVAKHSACVDLSLSRSELLDSTMSLASQPSEVSLADLPVEIIQTIYSFLDEPVSLRACSLTCSALAAAAKSSQVYRALFQNAFEPRHALATGDSDAYHQEFKQRWHLLRHPFSVTPDALTTILNMLFEADSSTFDLGKNMRHLLRARVGDLLEYDLAPNHPEASLRTSARPLFYKVTFLLLSSMLGPLSLWESKYAHQTQESPAIRLDEDDVFTYADLFHNHVTRISDTGKSSANIICATPPLDFAGA